MSVFVKHMLHKKMTTTFYLWIFIPQILAIVIFMYHYTFISTLVLRIKPLFHFMRLPFFTSVHYVFHYTLCQP